MKLRVPEIADWVTIWKQLGPTPTPIAWPEVYSALQTKVADGQENPLSNIVTAKLYEVQDYLVNTQHLHPVFNWVLSLKAVGEFSDANQKLIKDTIIECAKAGDADSKAEQESLLKQCIDNGMT
jgi:TRAP-type C4-dicarboxylate transport system substrate-binding protein